MTKRNKFITIMLTVAGICLVLRLLGLSTATGFGWSLGCAWMAWWGPCFDERKSAVRDYLKEQG